MLKLKLSLYILYWFVILLVVIALVAEVARSIDDTTFSQNIGRSPRRIQNYVVNRLTERFVKVEISFTRNKNNPGGVYFYFWCGGDGENPCGSDRTSERIWIRDLTIEHISSEGISRNRITNRESMV